MPDFQLRPLTEDERQEAVEKTFTAHLDFIIKRREEIIDNPHTIATQTSRSNPRKLWFISARNDDRLSWKKQAMKNAISAMKKKGIAMPQEILVYCSGHRYDSAGYDHPYQNEWHIFLMSSSVTYTPKESESAIQPLFRLTNGGWSNQGHFRLVGDLIYDGTAVRKDTKRCAATCLHEMGHALHQSDTSSAYYNWQYHRNDTLNYQRFLKPAKKVSQYATTEIHDFVAETFSGRMSGFRYTQDVLELYNLLGGPATGS